MGVPLRALPQWQAVVRLKVHVTHYIISVAEWIHSHSMFDHLLSHFIIEMLRKTINKNIPPLSLTIYHIQGCWSWSHSLLTLGETCIIPWTGHQTVTGLTHTVAQTTVHAHIHTYGQFRQTINVTCVMEFREVAVLWLKEVSGDLMNYAEALIDTWSRRK